jgi:uncharacterized membrane protein
MYNAGVDFFEYDLLARDLLEHPDLDKLKNAGVGYVYIGGHERFGDINTDVDFFRNELELVYSNEGVELYRVLM